MTVRGIVGKVCAVLALAAVAAGCGGGVTDSGPQASRTTSPATQTTPGAAPGSSPGSPPDKAPGAPSANAPQASGTAVIRTATLSGKPVPNVRVNLSLQQPCDPAGHDIPPGETNEARRWNGVTDGNGTATFSVPVGCYFFGLDKPAPPGTKPVPEGYHTLYVTAPGQKVDGLLRFEDPAPTGNCAPGVIAADLTDIGALKNATATVRECDGQWAVIVWDVHGDSQRIVRRKADRWSTYVVFPHDTCWARAAADGVPIRLKPYFTC
ncbi:hypothetical protein [Nocardia sp. NPDC052566]|uniref:hypothetical protein n=1 Tax=Nocardia sp. NPDC052566 TaxID=3364330 RepID=UPI0037C7046F